MNIERAVAAVGDIPIIDELLALYPEAVDHETRSRLVYLAAPKPVDWGGPRDTTCRTKSSGTRSWWWRT